MIASIIDYLREKIEMRVTNMYDKQRLAEGLYVKIDKDFNIVESHI